ncbi:hypothetical protein FHS83_000545 [Rhizomicrobium palustre]|uniref:Uncharacterized protein n=1 Tax=Rhizomicrobium palustre TaxID=189966 RepID=A0A846MW61_9PROT|nr:hypothetical protein [Rhizomicrobium palustre]NIK87227.1 hypothetical protein [Rhizomicrobium palustre]
MRKVWKAAVTAVAMATAMLAVPAKADSFGFSFNSDGGVGFSYESGGYCDRFGCPDGYWDMPIYDCPVYWGGSWYRGPVYYRRYHGRVWYWLHGDWRLDEWRGARPGGYCVERYRPALGFDFYERNGFRIRDDWRRRWYREHGRDWRDHDWRGGGWNGGGWDRRDDRWDRRDDRRDDRWDRRDDRRDNRWDRRDDRRDDRGNNWQGGNNGQGGRPGWQGNTNNPQPSPAPTPPQGNRPGWQGNQGALPGMQPPQGQPNQPGRRWEPSPAPVPSQQSGPQNAQPPGPQRGAPNNFDGRRERAAEPMRPQQKQD